MKRYSIAWISLILWAGAAWGQYGYQYLSGGSWAQAQFIGQEGWMVGTTGLVAHTKDGGRNWDTQTASFGLSRWRLGGVCFAAQQHGWICADEYDAPCLWHTDNGGRSWAPLPMTIGNIYSSKLAFNDTLHGWLVGGEGGDMDHGNIAATSDGGRTWSRQDTSHGWFSIYSTSPTKCWVGGWHGWVGRTTDGGASWEKQQPCPNKTLYGIFFSDPLNGWACGDSGAIIHTTDGGITWNQQVSGILSELLAIAFLNETHGFAVGDTGILLSTADGGRTWTAIPTGVSVALTTLSFGDSLHGWAIGEGGTTLETSDGGQTWRVTRRGTTDRIEAVSFVDDLTGWAASCEGKIWHSQDGGRNWERQTVYMSYGYLRGLTMVNAQTGYAVGGNGLILKTTNGGATWLQQRYTFDNGLRCVVASDAQHAWACGSKGTILQTSDGGARWVSDSLTWPDSGITRFASVDTLYGWAQFWESDVWATTNSGRTWSRRHHWYPLWGTQGLSFVDSSWGWAVCVSGIRRSTDGGRIWRYQPAAYPMQDIAGVTRMKAWAVGDSGKVLATTDGGETWPPQISNTAQNLLSVSFKDTLHGIIGGAGNLLLVTRNGGVAWDSVRAANGKTNRVFLVDSLIGWAAGNDGCLQKTTDGGYSWQTVFNKPSPLVAVHFAKRDTGWVAQEYQIYRTTDGGVSWDSVWTGGVVKDIRLATGRIGWCSIRYPGLSRFSNNELKVTYDRGDHWFTISEGRVKSLDFKSGDLLTSSSACFVGTGKLALRTYDGFSWDISPMSVDSPLSLHPFIPVQRGFSSGDGSTGWSVGRTGARVLTIDGGISWRLQAIDPWSPFNDPIDSLLTSVQAFDALTARAVGYQGRSFLTTDGGANWVREETGTKEWLLASSFLTPTLGWVVGEDGMVLKYGRLPYGVEEGEKTPGVPRVTWLGPNHPNPFTGETEIKYQLANKGKVRLVVYNILGQAVKKVVDKDQEPGTYGVTWDGRDEVGRNASSGVYFYRLEASGQSLTRKMVKIR